MENMEVWQEEDEEVECQSCASFDDVCLNYKELNSPTRKFTYDKTSPLYCDKDKRGPPDWQGPGWYRITGEAGTKLVDSPAEDKHCGTHAVGWLSGGHPTVAQGTVDRTVYFSYVGDNAYGSTLTVKVKNCNTHYVYYLKNVTGCSFGYCTE